MLETALSLRNVGTAKKISIKAAVAVGLVALAVGLPQLVHLALGQPGGAKWLPMYLPVLIAGCILGAKWGVMVGIASPLVSFLLTSLAGSAMPTLERVPFMMAELAVFAVISGLFTKKILKNSLWSFAACAAAIVSGRALFLLLAVIFNSFVSFTPAMILSQIVTGIPGVIVLLIVAPAVTMLVKKLTIKSV